MNQKSNLGTFEELGNAFQDAEQVKLFDKYVLSHRSAAECMPNMHPDGYWWIGEKVPECQLLDGVVSAYTYDDAYASDIVLGRAIRKAIVKFLHDSEKD